MVAELLVVVAAHACHDAVPAEAGLVLPVNALVVTRIDCVIVADLDAVLLVVEAERDQLFAAEAEIVLPAEGVSPRIETRIEGTVAEVIGLVFTVSGLQGHPPGVEGGEPRPATHDLLTPLAVGEAAGRARCAARVVVTMVVDVQPAAIEFQPVVESITAAQRAGQFTVAIGIRLMASGCGRPVST